MSAERLGGRERLACGRPHVRSKWGPGRLLLTVRLSLVREDEHSTAFGPLGGLAGAWFRRGVHLVPLPFANVKTAPLRASSCLSRWVSRPSRGERAADQSNRSLGRGDAVGGEGTGPDRSGTVRIR